MTEQQTPRTETPVEKFWKFLCSLKLAISVLILLAVASIVGTIIEQNQPFEKYAQEYGPGLARLFDSMWFFDMYHSWWFLFLLILFTVNLACCSIDRLPRVIRLVRGPKVVLDAAAEKGMPSVDRWKRKGTVESWVARYVPVLGFQVGPVRTTTADDGSVHLYAEKTPWSRFGVYVTHLSIIIIFIGAIIGNIWGFKGYVNIVEGDSVSSMQTRGGKGVIDFGFTVKCNKFILDMYPNGQPKDYKSDLCVIDQGKEGLCKTIEVNDPLVYKGIWFYQSSYGADKTGGAAISAFKPDGTSVGNFTLTPGQKVDISGYGLVSATDYKENFEGKGPAIHIDVEKPGGTSPLHLWVLAGQPDADRKRGDALWFTFGGLHEVEVRYTGLQVAKDPGVNIVWLGCLLMTVGILVAFFMAHQQAWIRISSTEDGKVDVVFGGRSNKNRFAFEKKYEVVCNALKSVE